MHGAAIKMHARMLAIGAALVCNLGNSVEAQEANKIGLAPNAKSYYSEGDVIALQVRRCASLPLAVAATRPRAAAVVALTAVSASL